MKQRRNILSMTFLLLLLAAAPSCRKAAPVYVTPKQQLTLYGIIKDNFNFSLFQHALQRTHLDTLLGGPGPFTVLLPDNVAFSQIGITADSALDVLDTGYLRQWMEYHILQKSLLIEDIPVTIQATYQSITGLNLYFSTAQNQYLNSSLQPGTLTINGFITIGTSDIQAGNGYIDVLSTPLRLPAPTVKGALIADTSLSFFVTGLRHFSLLDGLDSAGPFTILAPTNSAYLARNITLDSLNSLDSLHFKKYLFGVSILSPFRIFSTDFIDYPPLPAAHAGFATLVGSWATADGVLVFTSDDNFMVLRQIADANGPWFLGPWENGNQNSGDYGYGAPPQIRDPDHIAVNGVVHGLNNILIYPDSVRIQ